jgi:hypothetical protein
MGTFRLLADGSFDDTYAGAGYRFESGASAFSQEWVFDLAVDAVDRILLTGDASGDLMLARYLSDGTPDPTLRRLGQATGGMVTFGQYTPIGAAYGRRIMLDAAGKIVVVGQGYDAVGDPSTIDIVLLRFSPDS